MLELRQEGVCAVKEHRVFANGELILFVHLYAAVVPLFLAIVEVLVVLGTGSRLHWLQFVHLPFFYCLFLGIFSAVHCRAYHRVYLSAEGIRNKHLSFKWSEIKRCETAEVKINDKAPGRHTFVLTKMLCVGEMDGETMQTLDNEKCVYLVLSKRNIRLIHKLCGGKSHAVSEVLRLNSKEILK